MAGRCSRGQVHRARGRSGMNFRATPRRAHPAPTGAPAAPPSLGRATEGGVSAQGLGAPVRGSQRPGSAPHTEPTDPPQLASRSPTPAHRPTHNSLISTIFREPPHSCRRRRRHRRASQDACAARPPNGPSPGRAGASAPFRRGPLRQRAWGLAPPRPRPTLGARALHGGCAARWRARAAGSAPAHTRRALRLPCCPTSSRQPQYPKRLLSSEFSSPGP